jgi:hypothetical protein
MKISPKFLYNKDGEKEQVLLSYKDFMTLIEKMEDLEDLIALREAREKNKDQPFYTKEEMMEEFAYLYEEDGEDEEETHSKKKAQ